jgi:hypothetical protein
VRVMSGGWASNVLQPSPCTGQVPAAGAQRTELPVRTPQGVPFPLPACKKLGLLPAPRSLTSLLAGLPSLGIGRLPLGGRRRLDRGVLSAANYRANHGGMAAAVRQGALWLLVLGDAAATEMNLRWLGASCQ